MAVPHLDTRVIDGKKYILFGPFGSWTTKFLHEKGSFMDLPLSVKPDNIVTLIQSGLANFPLVQYLVGQCIQTMQDRINVLREFYPDATGAKWDLIDAGIRVQAIKKTDGKAGIVHFGTEVLSNSKHTISALLGASPGASTSVFVMIQTIKECFPELLASAEGKAKMNAMIPVFGEDLLDPANHARFREVDEQASRNLQLV
jgi:malate dehydrogenase (quinone)